MLIGTEPKPFDEVERAIEEFPDLLIVGCGGCATVCHTGGEPEVAQMAERLAGTGKRVLATVVPKRSCYIHRLRESLGPLRKEMEAAHAILSLGCGGAVQTVRQLTQEYELLKPIVAALNSKGHMDTLVEDALWMERCSSCGDCMLNETGGICPMTLCPKGLVNGPCGGTREDGTCEVNPDQPCAWQLIYERLEALGQLANLRRIRPPKDWGKKQRPRRLVRDPEAEGLAKQLT